MRRAGRGTITRWGIAAIVGLTLLTFPTFGPTSILAAEETSGVAFDAPTGSGALGEPMILSTTFASKDAPIRVELISRRPSETALFVEIAQVRELGGGRFEATVTREGHVTPNTTFLYRFRVTTAAGIATGPEGRLTVADERVDFQVTEGALVRLHSYEGDEAFRTRALKVGEDAVEKVSDLLGVQETEPIDFFVYADDDAFYGALGPGTRENVGGQAHAAIRTMFALIEPSAIESDWIDVVVPHELTHLVFNTAVENDLHFPPRWLNEGLAVYVSEGNTDVYRATVQGAIARADLIPLNGLAGFFPTSRERFLLAYAESVSAVEFFVRSYGEEKLVALIRSYAGGVTDEEAFRDAIGIGADEFNDAWLADLGASQPAEHGPREAAPGPLPPGWELPDGAIAGPSLSASPGAPLTTVGPGGSTTASLTPGAPGGATGDAGSGNGLGEVFAVVGTIAGLAGLVVLAVILVRRRDRPDRPPA